MTSRATPDPVAQPGIPLGSCELEGGAEALATQLLDVPVVPGSELSCVVEASGARGEPLVVVWGEPAFIGQGVAQSVLEAGWQRLAQLPGDVVPFRAPAVRELLLGGRPCDEALLLVAPAGLRVRVPAGAERLVMECGFDGGALPGPLARVRCSVYNATPA